MLMCESCNSFPKICNTFPIYVGDLCVRLAGVREGRFPKSVKLGKRTNAWRVRDIRALIEEEATK